MQCPMQPSFSADGKDEVVAACSAHTACSLFFVPRCAVLQGRGPNRLDAWRAWLLRRLIAELASGNGQTSCLEVATPHAYPL